MKTQSNLPPLRVAVWRTEHDFHAHAQAWKALAAQVEPQSVFFNHEWFDAAWQWERLDSQLHIFAFFQDTHLVGIAPFTIRREGPWPAQRTLRFLSVPDTQVCDILVMPGSRQRIIDRLFDELTTSRDWDTVELPFLPATVAAEFQLAARRRGITVTQHDQGRNPGISLEDTWSDYYARRSRRLKKGNNLIANKLKKGGHEFHLEHFSGDALKDNAALSQLIDEIVSISANSWKRSTGRSLDRPGPNAFIRRLSELAAQRGWLSVWRLEIDGKALAMEYQLSYDGHIHALRSDFDDSAGDLSPGTYLNWKMLEQLFDGLHTHYLMGPGENAYKLRWAETFAELHKVTVYNNTLTGHWLALRETRLRPLLRSARALLTRVTPHKKESS